jgi:hypothetical protein
MRFERGKDPKRAMHIGDPPKRIYRLLVWRKGPDKEPGFYIIQNVPKELEEICNGEKKVGHYIVDFWGSDIPDKEYSEQQLYKSRGKYVEYSGKLYLIPSGK